MAFPTTSILDNFNRANGNLTTPWTNRVNSLAVDTNQVKGNTSSYNRATYEAASYGPDVECYVTITTAPGNNKEIDIGARFDASLNGYVVILYNLAGTDRIEICRSDAGSLTTLGASFTQEVSAGDSLGIEIVGSNISAYYKPAAGSWTLLGTRTDSTYTAAGYLELLVDSTTGRVDNFGGGTISSGTPGDVTSVPMTSTASFKLPTVTGNQPANVTSVPMTSTASLKLPVVSGATDPYPVKIPIQTDFTLDDSDMLPHDTPIGSYWDDIYWGGLCGNIHQVGGIYYFYYVGAKTNGDPNWDVLDRAIGLATSTDLVNWTKHASNPIITYTTGGSQEEGAANPTIIIRNGTWHMYYSASRDVGGGAVDVDIRYRSSTDGITWTNDTLIYQVSGDEYIPIGVFHDGTNYHLYYLGPLIGGAGALRHCSGSVPTSMSGHAQILAGTFRAARGMQEINPTTMTLVLGGASGFMSVRTINKSTPTTVSSEITSYQWTSTGTASISQDWITKKWLLVQEEASEVFYLRTADLVPDTITPPKMVATASFISPVVVGGQSASVSAVPFGGTVSFNIPVVTGSSVTIYETGGSVLTEETNHTVNLPDGSNVAGRRLLLFFTTDGSGETFTPPDGSWIKIFSEDGSGFTTAVYYHEVTGLEGYPATGATVIFVGSSVEQSAHTTYLFPSDVFDSASAPQVSVVAEGTGTSPDPNSLSPSWGADDNIWFVYAVGNGLSATEPVVTGWPTNYSTNAREDRSDGPNGITTGASWRVNNSATEDAGSFTLNASVTWLALTVVVKPQGVPEALVNAVPFSGTAFLIPPIITGVQSATVISVPAVTSASFNIPVVIGSQSALVNAVPMISMASFGTPVVTAGQSPIVNAVPVTSTASFGVPNISTGQSTIVNAIPMTSTISFGTPVVTAGQSLVVNAIPMTSTISFGIPVVTAGQSPIVNSVPMTSTASFGVPNISTGQSIIVNSVPMTSTVSFGTPVVTAGQSPIVNSVPMTSTASFGTPIVSSGQVGIVNSVPMTSTISFGTPVVTAGQSPIVNVVPMISTASFGIPNVTAVQSGIILSVPMTSMISFGTPIVTGGASVISLPLIGTASFNVPIISASQNGSVLAATMVSVSSFGIPNVIGSQSAIVNASFMTAVSSFSTPVVVGGIGTEVTILAVAIIAMCALNNPVVSGYIKYPRLTITTTDSLKYTINHNVRNKTTIELEEE